MMQGHKRDTINATVTSSISATKYLKFSSPRTGNEAKHSVEFHHSMQCFKNSVESRDRVLTLGFQVSSAYPTMWRILREAKKIIIYLMFAGLVFRST